MRLGVAWSGMVGPGELRTGAARAVRPVWNGTAGQGLFGWGPAWLALVSYGTGRKTGLARLSTVWHGSERFGKVWSGTL